MVGVGFISAVGVVAKKQCNKPRGPGSMGTYPWRGVTWISTAFNNRLSAPVSARSYCYAISTQDAEPRSSGIANCRAFLVHAELLGGRQATKATPTVLAASGVTFRNAIPLSKSWMIRHFGSAMNRGWLVRAQETPSVFLRIEQRNASHHRDVRQQSRLCARWNQSLRRSLSSNPLCWDRGRWAPSSAFWSDRASFALYAATTKCQSRLKWKPMMMRRQRKKNNRHQIFGNFALQFP
jgi:hypothetical protein